MSGHTKLSDMQTICSTVKEWLHNRYGTADGEKIWEATAKQYEAYMEKVPRLRRKKEPSRTCNIRRDTYFFPVPIIAGSPSRVRASGICDRYIYGTVCKAWKSF